MTNGATQNPIMDRAVLTFLALCIVTLYGAAIVGDTSRLFRSPPQVEQTVATLPLPAAENIITTVQPQETRPRKRAGAKAIMTAFDRIDYSLEAVANAGAEVPMVHLRALPGDLRRIADTEDRKDLFLRMMLPLVLEVNEGIAADRRRLQSLQRQMARAEPVLHADREWLADMMIRYRLEPNAGIAKLLRRVDVVPPSIALAQAATESGWGTSRLARTSNVLFGQCTDDDDPAAVAARDNTNKLYHYKSFATPIDAVRAYVHNLNTHPAYDGFRRARGQMRAQGATPSGEVLVGGLEEYAEASEYARALLRVMRANDLSALDTARLAAEGDTLRF